jgi:predicted TIM-barrel fold metal-dependent hydrolase
MKRLYCDTALSAFPSTLTALRAVIGNSHVLFGSDYPYAPAKAIEISIKVLDNFPTLDFIGHNQIARRNALRLFPRLSAS